MQFNGFRFFSPPEICADPTEEGIRAVEALGDLGSQPREELDKDSDFDKNKETLAWERGDFEDEDEMVFDVDQTCCAVICFSACDADVFSNLNNLDEHKFCQDMMSQIP
jgi:hypothetical protein